MSDTLTWPMKDPDEVLDYGINWLPELDAGVTIDSSQWAVSVGTLVIDSDEFDGNSTTVRLSGGTANLYYTLINTVHTTAGETHEQVVILPVREKSTEPIGCPLPTVSSFRARFPEFANVPSTQVQLAIDDASCWADTSWIVGPCNDCTKAIAYLAAHFLALGLFAAEMLPDTLPPETPGGPVIIPGGQVTSIRFESMSVGFSSPKAVGGQGGEAGTSGMGDQWAIGGTPYGQMFLMLVKVNKPAVLVV